MKMPCLSSCPAENRCIAVFDYPFQLSGAAGPEEVLLERRNGLIQHVFQTEQLLRDTHRVLVKGKENEEK